jgi:hypothetical protein
MPNPAGTSSFDDDDDDDARAPDEDELIGKAHPMSESVEEGEQQVARRVNPLPLREDEEEELSEADIMEELDDDDLEDMEGSGA